MEIKKNFRKIANKRPKIKNKIWKWARNREIEEGEGVLEVRARR